MTQEIELKLEIDPDDLPLLLENSLLEGAKSNSFQQTTVYYDTANLLLKKNGLTLRVRSADGRFIETVKPTSNRVGLLAREETNVEIESATPDLASLGKHPVNRLLEKSPRQLDPIIRSEVTRTRAEIERGDAHIELDLDRGIMCAGGRSERFAEIEFELIEGSPVDLVIAARRLCETAPVRLGVLTKAERGFQLLAGKRGKVTKAGHVHVHHGMTVKEAFEVIVNGCLKHYRLNERIVISKLKPEALHQARVAMRRLRSAMSLFRPAIRDVEFRHLRHELRWFNAQLGKARNLDVFLERDLAAEVRAKARSKRDNAYDEVADAMNSQRFRRLLIDIVGWSALGAWRKGKVANRSISTFANRRLEKFWRSIVKPGGDIRQMDENSRHLLRIQVKKMRYAIDFLRDLYSQREAQKHFTLELEELQDALGRLNDLAIARNIAGVPHRNAWLNGSKDARQELRRAKAAYNKLMEMGPFWHNHASVKAAAHAQ